MNICYFIISTKDMEINSKNFYNLTGCVLTSSFLSTLAGVYLPGKYSLIHEVNVLFKKPVFVSDSPLTIKGKVIDINEIFKQITIKVEIVNKNNDKVLRGTMKVGIINE